MSTPAPRSEVVITGLGVVAPTGFGVKEFWTAALEGRNGIGAISRFDASRYPAGLAGEIAEFPPSYHLPSRLLPQTDHSTRLSLFAVEEALADAELDLEELPDYSVGVTTANSAGGFAFGHQELDNLWRHGPDHVSAYQSFAWFYAVNTGQISIRHGFRGPSGVLVADQAGGLDALAEAARHVRRGLPIAVAGAVDGSLCPWGWVAHTSSGRLSPATDPTRAYLPFDDDAAGSVPGEGGAIMVLEEASAARARGARVLGRLLGHASTFDGRGDDTRPRGAGLRRALELALDDAGLHPGDVDVVFADAAAIPEQDEAEAYALGAVFGGRRVPVAIPKTATGRLCAGAGPLDVAAALLTMDEGVVPPAAHLRPSARMDLDLVVGQPRSVEARTAVVLARGAGGFNSAVVVGAGSARAVGPVTGAEQQGAGHG